MAYADAHGFVVLTHDLDFSAILAASRNLKPSVVQIRTEDTSPDVIGIDLIRVLAQFAAELDASALISFDVLRARVRLLPLASR